MDITYINKMIIERDESLWIIGYRRPDRKVEYHAGMIADGSLEIRFYEVANKSETTESWFGGGGGYADETCDGIRLPEDIEFAIEKALILQ